MALSKIRQANKKFRHEQRRRKIRKLHKLEEKRMSAGDYRPIADRHKRQLKNRRNHHRRKDQPLIDAEGLDEPTDIS